jgi:hypothetical protein
MSNEFHEVYAAHQARLRARDAGLTMADRSKWLVLAGSSLVVTKREHWTAAEAIDEVVSRLRHAATFMFGRDRLSEMATAQRLTPDLEAAYRQIAYEASVAYRRAAREAIKAGAVQQQFAVAA